MRALGMENMELVSFWYGVLMRCREVGVRIGMVFAHMVIRLNEVSLVTCMKIGGQSLDWWKSSSQLTPEDGRHRTQRKGTKLGIKMLRFSVQKPFPDIASYHHNI